MPTMNAILDGLGRALRPESIADETERFLLGGETQNELQARAQTLNPAIARGLQEFAGDKRAHFLASKILAERFGSVPAMALMTGKEALTGLGSLAGGGDFFGAGGFDPQDLIANQRGVEAAGPNVASIIGRGLMGAFR